MATEWFEKQAGDKALALANDEGVVLIGDLTPDWVRLPDVLGGGRVRVVSAHGAPCPMCGDAHPVQHLRVEGGLGVAECGAHGFVWYRGLRAPRCKRGA